MRGRQQSALAIGSIDRRCQPLVNGWRYLT
jgi:hypothetical protein